MPLLTDKDIFRELRAPKRPEDPLIIHPILDKRQIWDCKVELRMDNELYRFKQGQPAEFSLDEEIILNEYADRIIIPYGSPLVVHPGELLVTYSFEFIRMPRNMMARMEPRPRLAKVGLTTSFGTVDPGFEDHLLILFVNSGRFSLKLKPLMRVVGMSINELRGEVETSMKEKTIKRPPIDPDHLVVNVKEYDSQPLGSYGEIVSEDYVSKELTSEEVKIAD